MHVVRFEMKNHPLKIIFAYCEYSLAYLLLVIFDDDDENNTMVQYTVHNDDMKCAFRSLS